MAEEFYPVFLEPQYREYIRALQDSDEASASTVFNPLIERLIENIHYVYLRQRAESRHVIAVRVRDPSKPDYGLEETQSVTLRTAAYSGAARASAVVEDGQSYDVTNLSPSSGEVSLLLSREDGKYVLNSIEIDGEVRPLSVVADGDYPSRDEMESAIKDAIEDAIEEEY